MRNPIQRYGILLGRLWIRGDFVPRDLRILLDWKLAKPRGGEA